MSAAGDHALLDAVPLPVLLVGSNERVMVANTAARALWGEALAGRTFVTVLRQPALGAALARALGAGEESRSRITLGRGGSETVFLAHCAPVAPPGDGALLFFENVTAQEQAEAMRRDFVANVSHELRTPLTALIGFIETLRNAARDDPAARARFLDVMEREAGRMNRLIGDLLSLSRVEAGEHMRPSAPVDVAGITRSVIQMLRPMAEQGGIVLRLEDGAEGVQIPADADQLTQVFQNLIENAIKYGGQGGEVLIEITRIAHEPVLRGPAVAVLVSDRGEGIDPLHLPRLTERFYRVDSHRSRAQGGTGLGLAIVKHIVARHRGRLRIDSERGKGSRFTVILPER